MNDLIRLDDKSFKRSISAAKIQLAIEQMAVQINEDLKEKKPLFLCVLNGSFMFAADLMKKLRIDCEISFVKLASYHGTSSTGEIRTLIGLDGSIKDRTVVILEDIVDTGLTLESLIGQLTEYSAKEVKVATCLFKPDAYTKDIPIDYVAMEIPDRFIVGYGLDYKGLGRNLEDIYVLSEK